MALNKEISLPNGVISDFWRISHILIDRQSELVSLTFRIGLFMSREIAKSGVTPFVDENFTFQVAEEDLAGDIRALGYSKIKNSISAVDEDGNPISSSMLVGASDAISAKSQAMVQS